jgi:hypothetical protein
LVKEDDFLSKTLPIANKSESADGTANRAYEIDLSSTTKLEKRMGIGKLDCFPVLVVFSFASKTEWTVKLKQRVAAKYLVIKLIDSYKNSASDNNIDMYNLTLNGYTLSIPSTS